MLWIFPEVPLNKDAPVRVLMVSILDPWYMNASLLNEAGHIMKWNPSVTRYGSTSMLETGPITILRTRTRWVRSSHVLGTGGLYTESSYALYMLRLFSI